MVNIEKKIWGIHTLNDSLFLNDNVIAIGWNKMGDLTGIDASREAFKKRYAEVFPEASKQSIATGAGMLFRFVHEINVGDYVVFPSKTDRKIYLGIIKSDYYFSPGSQYDQRREVKWLKNLPRTVFSQGALYEIGSALTLFSIKNYAEEYLNAIEKKDSFYFSFDSKEEDETVAATAEEIVESTKDYLLKELSKNLKGYDFEDFVANLLTAMGYRTKVSSHGGDNGIDITAYKDELPPRILVQVKSQDADIKESTIQSLKGAMREGDYGLFVTLSNYTKNAQKYLNSTPIIRGINGTELVELILKYYDKLDEKYQRMFPLKKVYIPVPVKSE